MNPMLSHPGFRADHDYLSNEGLWRARVFLNERKRGYTDRRDYVPMLIQRRRKRA